MKRMNVYVGLGLCLLCLCGCQTVLAPLGLHNPARAYVKQAREYESQGDLVAALEQYQLAQTADPEQPEINDRVVALTKKLDDLAETHYRAGLRFRDKGRWDLAKKELLTALGYRPEHKEALNMLQHRQPEGERKFITHKVAPGESLSKLALKYYGDYKKYYHIVNFNDITNAAQVRVGQRIMIPVIAGVTIDDLYAAAESQLLTDALEQPTDLTETPPAAEPEPLDRVAGYRQTGMALFNQKNYPEAIVELQKVINVTPDDADAIDYITRAYVELGKAHLAARRFDEAKTAFTTALDYDKNCQECLEMLTRSRTVEAVSLRTEAEKLLRNNQFDPASAALERAVTLNPEDGAAAELLFQTYFQKALLLYNQQDYLAAGTGFEKAAIIKPDCHECRQYIADSLEAYKEFHYNAGIVFFGQEELKKAITSWEKVVAVDPDYKDVRQNLNKAILLNDRLERIRESTAE